MSPLRPELAHVGGHHRRREPGEARAGLHRGPHLPPHERSPGAGVAGENSAGGLARRVRVVQDHVDLRWYCPESAMVGRGAPAATAGDALVTPPRLGPVAPLL